MVDDDRPSLRDRSLDASVPDDILDHGCVRPRLGYQSNQGHQGRGMWTPSQRSSHINVKELRVIVLALQREPSLRDQSLQVLTDKTSTVSCVNRQGSARSRNLLRVSEQLFNLLKTMRVHLVATHLKGSLNLWADALSRQDPWSVELELKTYHFASLVKSYGPPQIDLFATPYNKKRKLFISRTMKTRAGGPDAFSVDWNRWDFLYLFPPPLTSIMLKVLRQLRSFRGKVMLIAPLWPAQPWYPELVRQCPSPVPLRQDCLVGEDTRKLSSLLKLHVWNFSI